MSWRKLLFPFSVMYGAVSSIRNKCYALGILHSWEIPVKAICVGNLSTGGTGKTPHVAYLASYFLSYRKVAILSRGYGRSSSGFQLVNPNSTATEVGDEPLFYALNFGGQVTVAVCENRKKGVEMLLQMFPFLDLIILDDAFQHRAVKAGFNILLTKASLPFSSDFLLPAGNLRESRNGRKRADMVVVTKCQHVGLEDVSDWSARLKFLQKNIYCSGLIYGKPVSFGKKADAYEEVLLISGIADPSPLIFHLSQKVKLSILTFRDHHEYTSADIQKIHQKFDTFTPKKGIILTTEKDFMRLRMHIAKENLEKYPWYYLPISVEIHNEEEFIKTIKHYVDAV